MQGGQLIELPLLRTSERKDFKRCPQRWWWAWRDGLRPQGPDPINLWFGTGIHLALAKWYVPGTVRGIDPRETFEEFVKSETRMMKLTFKDEYGQYEKEFVESGPLGEDMLTGYLSEYGWDEAWEFISPEQTFRVILRHPVHGKLVRYVGTFDGVFIDHEQDGAYRLLETKTAKTISTSHLSLDDQGGGYWAIATNTLRAQGLIPKNGTIDYIVYNFLRKALDDPRPRNEQGLYLNQDHSVSKKQPKPRFERFPLDRNDHERNVQLKRIMAESQAMRRFETGEQEMYKSPSWNCSWDCQFFQMCELHEQSPDWEEYRDSVMRKRDPYADHRKSAAE
jgi:hypothetical protein